MHAVRVPLELAVMVECDLDTTLPANALDDARNRVGVDGLRFMAVQAQQNSRVSAVPFACPRKRAEQRHAITSSVAGLQRKSARRFHRADRMRARRTDADLKDVEYAEGLCH